MEKIKMYKSILKERNKPTPSPPVKKVPLNQIVHYLVL